MRLAIHFCLAFSAGLTLTTAASAGDREVPGPVEVDVVRVIDGDTFVADAHVWPGQTIRVAVRIRGIDSPELHSRCAAERDAGQRSRAALQTMLAAGAVEISGIGGGKYYGRVLADVSVGGLPVGRHLLSQALARSYAGGKRRSYCAANHLAADVP